MVGVMQNGFPSRGHQRGSASAAAQAWLEKEIYVFSPSKTNICLRRIRLSAVASVDVYSCITPNYGILKYYRT
jgi:hypothetical protein